MSSKVTTICDICEKEIPNKPQLSDSLSLDFTFWLILDGRHYHDACKFDICLGCMTNKNVLDSIKKIKGSVSNARHDILGMIKD